MLIEQISNFFWGVPITVTKKIYLGFTYDVTRKAYKASYIEDLWTTICFACYTGSYLF